MRAPTIFPKAGSPPGSDPTGPIAASWRSTVVATAMTRIAARTSWSKSRAKSSPDLAKRATRGVEKAPCTQDCAMNAWTHSDRRNARRVAGSARARAGAGRSAFR